MKRIDGVDIVQVCGCRFIGKVNRMVQRQIPYREGFKFRVSRVYVSFMLMKNLGQAGRHFSAARPRCRNNHQGFSCFNIRIWSVALFTYHMIHVHRIAVYRFMDIYLFASAFKFVFKHIRRGLILVLGYHNTANVKPHLPDVVGQAEHVHIIGDSQISPYSVLFDVSGVYAKNYFGFFF